MSLAKTQIRYLNWVMHVSLLSQFCICFVVGQSTASSCSLYAANCLIFWFLFYFFASVTILVMIFVNQWQGQYWFFEHSTWNGLLVADLVFAW